MVVNAVSDQMRPAHQASRAALRFIEHRQSMGRAHFTLTELTTATGLTLKAAREQLAHLDKIATRVSPRQEFFVIVNPEQRPMGAPPVFWWLDEFFKARKQPYYVGLLSAAAEHGSSNQAVQAVQVMTDHPIRDLMVGRLRVQFFVKKRLLDSPTMPLAAAYAPLVISTPETTAIDLLRYAHRIGGVGRAAEVIAGLLGRFRKSSLRKALLSEAETSSIQRLGYVLQELGRAELCDVVADYLPSRRAVVTLEKHKPIPPGKAATTSGRWSVLVNARLNVVPT